MEFDPSNVYTRENADDLQSGDIVCVANTMSGLREAVKNDKMSFIEEIWPADCPIARIRTVASNYFFAYLVCPARNAKAYWAWENDKPIEMQVVPDGPWHDVTADEIKSTKDFWFHHAIRAKK